MDGFGETFFGPSAASGLHRGALGLIQRPGEPLGATPRAWTANWSRGAAETSMAQSVTSRMASTAAYISVASGPAQATLTEGYVVRQNLHFVRTMFAAWVAHLYSAFLPASQFFRN
jgi:hypothetical protein